MAIIKLLASKSPVSNAVNYVTQKEKTEDKLISGVNCMPESVVDEFEMTKQKFNKLGGRTYYHMIQSFASDDDITPEQAHEIGLQMAEHCFPGYQVLVATHIDRQHTHNHFVINSVNMVDGKKMDVAPQDLIDIKNYSNYLCEKNGFKTTEAKTDRNRMPRWKFEIKILALRMMSESYSMLEFIEKMKLHGVEVKYNPDYKYMTYTDAEGHRVRDSKLFDERLLKENLQTYFELGGCESPLTETILNYETPKSGDCTTGLDNLIFDVLGALPTPEPDFDNYDYYDVDDKALDILVLKMRAHGIRITKAELNKKISYNMPYDREQEQGLIW